MKKRKGFTLVELIAVIALLAVIMTIAGISIVSIKNNTLKGERENLRTTIKIAAKEYHEETGVEIVPVLVLIQTGRIEADEFDSNGDPVIYDPYDKKVINCECVNFKESEDGKWDSKTDCCDPAIIANEVNINYIYSDEGTTAKAYTYVEEDKWFAMGNGQTLQFIGAIDKVNDKPVEYTWINPSAPDFAVEGLTFDVELPELGYIDSAYTVNANFSGYYASKTFGIKVDGKKPILENYYIENMETWSQNKTLHADFKDGESGIYGYYLNYSTEGCSKNKSSYKTTDGAGNTITGTKEFTLNETIDTNGTLSICLMDNAGNFVESSEKVLVTHIDKTAPTLSLIIVNGTTYYQNNDVTVTLEDPGAEGDVSGFTAPSYTVKYKWSTSNVSCSSISNSNTITLTDPDGDGKYTGTVSIGSNTGQGKVYVCPNGTIADQAGNTVANTPVSETMYLDNTLPTIGSVVVTSNNTTYNDQTVKVAVSSINEEDSGLKEICLTTSDSSEDCDWKSNGAASYNFPNVNTNLTVGTGNSITYYVFVKDKADNISLGKSKTYRIYGYCDETKFDHYGAYGECTKACGNGKKYRDVYYNDQYFTDYYCSTDEAGDYTSCNTQECCSSVYFTEGSECSKSCGGGKKIMYAKSNYDDSRCPGQDKYTGSACNTQACCDEGTWSYSYCDCDGYKVEERYNGCTKKWESRETSSSCTDIWDYDSSYGSCSTTCGTGTKTRNKYCTTASGSTRSSSDSTSCTDNTGCVDKTVKCYLYASKRDNSHINCFWNSNVNCKYESTGGTYVDAYTRYWSVGKSGTDTCWGKTVNGTSASNYLRFNGTTAQYKCDSKGWCNC